MTPAEAAIREALAAAGMFQWPSVTHADLTTLLSELDALRADNANLRTVMIAAAEEIAAHWDAHCDAEGYGPQNLQRRLEEGIPSKYGYTAGAFAALRARCEAAEALLREAVHQATTLDGFGRGKLGPQHWISLIDAHLKGAGRE